MNRAISGTLVDRENGRPLTGMQVVAARVHPGGLELLGATLSGDFGRFRVAYAPLLSAGDLTLLIFCPAGRHLFTEPVHLAVGGAELQVQVEIPGGSL